MKMKRKILITGSSGRLGNYLAKGLFNRYQVFLTDKIESKNNTYDYPFTKLDLSESDNIVHLFENIDTVLHFAATPNPFSHWNELLPSNIIALYNTYNAAHKAKCKRIIFASSVHTVGGCQNNFEISADVRPMPLNLYGTTKAWGEAVAYYFSKKNLSSICLRLGWVRDRNDKEIRINNPNLDIFLSYQDLVKLVIACIEVPLSINFLIVNGLSNNREKRLNIEDTIKILNYEPADNAFEIAMRNETKHS